MSFVESAVLLLNASQPIAELNKLNAKLRQFEAANKTMADGTTKIADKQVAATKKVVEGFDKQAGAAEKTAKTQTVMAERAAKAQVAAAGQAIGLQNKLRDAEDARVTKVQKDADKVATAQQKSTDRAVAAQQRGVDRQLKADERAEKANIARQIKTAQVDAKREVDEINSIGKAAAQRQKFVDAQVRDQNRLERASIDRQMTTARLAEKEMAVAERVAATEARVAERVVASQSRKSASMAASAQRARESETRYVAKHVAHAAGVPYSTAAAGVHGMHIAENGGLTTTAILGGAAALGLGRATIGAGAANFHTKQQMEARGFNHEGDVEIDGQHVHGRLSDIAQANAARLSKKYQTVSENEALKIESDFSSIFGDEAHSIEGAESSVGFMQFMKSWMGGDAAHGKHGQLIHQLEAAVKSGELMGKASPKEMDEFYKTARVSVMTYGDQAKLDRILMAQRLAGGMYANTSQDFRLGFFPALVQETEGGGAGRQISMLYRHITGSKKLKDPELDFAAKYDLLETKANGMAGLKNTARFQKDPDLWAQDVIQKVAAAEGMPLPLDDKGMIKTDEKSKAQYEEIKLKLDPILKSGFADQNAQRFMSENLLQWNKWHKERILGAKRKADFDAGSSKDFDDGKSAYGARAKIDAQLNNVSSGFGQHLIEPLMKLAEPLAGGLNRIGDNAKNAPLATAGAAGLAAYGAFRGATAIMNQLSGAAALNGSAASLTGSAGAITAAASRLGLAGPVGKGAAAAVGPGFGAGAGVAAGSTAASLASRAGSLAMRGLGIFGTVATVDMIQQMFTGVSVLELAAQKIKEAAGFGEKAKETAAQSAERVKEQADKAQAAFTASNPALAMNDEALALIREIDSLDADRDAKRIARLTKQVEALKAASDAANAKHDHMQAVIDYAASLPEDPRSKAWSKQAREAEAQTADDEKVDEEGDAELEAAELAAKQNAKTGVGDAGSFGNFQTDPGSLPGAAGGKADEAAAAINGWFDAVIAWVGSLKPGTIGAPADEATSRQSEADRAANQFFGDKPTDGTGGAGSPDAANDNSVMFSSAIIEGGLTASADLANAMGTGAEAISAAGTTLGTSVESGGTSAASVMQSAIVAGGESAGAAISAAMANAAANVNINVSGAASYEGKRANTGSNVSGR